jgi:hypothetical protein
MFCNNQKHNATIKLYACTFYNENELKDFDEIVYESFYTTRYLRENVLVICIGLNVQSGAEPNDKFRKALLLYKCGRGLSLYTEKEMMSCHFRTCSVTMDGWSM